MTDTSVIDTVPLNEMKKGPGTEIAISEGSFGAVRFENVSNVINLGQIMSRADVAVPKHLRNNPGACVGICFYASEWKLSPYAVANKSYVVNDRLAFESQLVHAVIETRAPLAERLKSRFEGEGNDRICIVWAKVKGEVDPLEWRSPKFGLITPKNSPLWKSDPDMQLFYYTSRTWARRWFPEILLGVYSRDEIDDVPAIGAEAAKDVTPAQSGPGLAARLVGSTIGDGFRHDNVENGRNGRDGEPSGRTQPEAEKPTEPTQRKPRQSRKDAPADPPATENPADTKPDPAAATAPAEPDPAERELTAQSDTPPPASPGGPSPDLTAGAGQTETGGGSPATATDPLSTVTAGAEASSQPPSTVTTPAGSTPELNVVEVEPDVWAGAKAALDASSKNINKPEEFVAYCVAWMTAMRDIGGTESGLKVRWNAESKERGRCSVVGDIFSALKEEREVIIEAMNRRGS